MENSDLTTSASLSTPPAVLLVNTASRLGARRYEDVRRILKENNVNIAHMVPVTRAGALPRFIQAAIDAGSRRLLIGGGDGSVSCAADRILASGKDIELGVIPLGTGNDFARAIGMPLRFNEAIRAVTQLQPRRIDVGRVNGRTFLNAASVGLTTAIAQALTPEVKRRFGPFAYALTAARCGLRQEPFVVKLRRPDEPPLELSAVQLVVGNGPFHGGGRRVSPESEIDDGMLDVYAILSSGRRLSPARAASLLRIGAKMNRGRHVDHHRVLQLRTTELSVITEPTQEANVDGELLEADSLHFEVMPRALTVLAP